MSSTAIRTKVPTISPRVAKQATRVSTTAPTATLRITGRALQQIRRRHFQQQPLCVKCKAEGRTVAATEVDHVVPLWNGGADHESNRQSLCDACHAEKTAAESKLRASIR